MNSHTNGSGVRAAAGALEQSGAALKSEFQHVIADLEDLLRSSTALSAEEFTRLKDQIGERLTKAKDTLIPVGQNVVDRARRGIAATGQYVEDEPWKAVGIGAALGFLLGLLVARR
jgi:ElaB/YqjD/DUF883 family membrane-anchored ribosome-binding protein